MEITYNDGYIELLMF